ncbi:MAG TPA: hypothetical protein VK936_13910 [Longimicrobiales bacterium]|nr:hypothetical protein [Longimicrobiales bacterium]
MRKSRGDEHGLQPRDRTARNDSMFLAAVTVLAWLPYVAGLGLYSDDWGFVASLHAADGSYHGLLESVMGPLGPRPVQGHLLAGLYWLFGLDIVWWHVANGMALVAIVLLLHHSLRRLGVPRAIALAAPLLFGLLPHYSTDRFWIAVFQANASVLLYATSLYADIRFVHARPAAVRSRWAWKAAGTAALIASVLAYEVTAALFLVTVVALLHAAGVLRRGSRGRRSLQVALAVGSNVVALALTVAYKLSVTERADVGGGLRFRALRILTEAVPVHFGELGVGLPTRVLHALRHYPDPAIVGVSLVIGLAVAAYLLRLAPSETPARGTGAGWAGVAAAGLVVFVAGYGVALMTWEIGFHATGANNRTAIGAALGVALVFTAAVGWLASLLPTPRLRVRAFAGGIALIAACSTLITATVARFWVAASDMQQDIIAALARDVPELPVGAVLLLDGVCPFHGPAPVFATDWDVTGMLRIMYGDGSLRGDVIKSNTTATSTGIRTILFDDWINVYSYGELLRVYHAGSGRSYTLYDRTDAEVYFAAAAATGTASCPPYTDGDGTDVF